MSQAEPMIKFLHSVSDRDYAPLSTVEEVSAANTELHILSVRCLELSREIARMRQLVDRLAHSTGPSQPRERSHSEDWLIEDSSSPDHRRRRVSGSNFQFIASAENAHPVRSELARACRIALMETNEPASVEAIYDRIKRRGSFTFARYKRPVRSIALAMSAMVRSGEVSVSNDAGGRRWRWGTERMGDKPGSGTTLYGYIPAEPALKP
jgi:hypothetical protein